MAKGETQHYVFVFDDGQLSSSLGGHALFSRSRHHRADGRQGSASPSKAPLASLWDAWLTKVPTWNNSKQPALGEQVGLRSSKLASMCPGVTSMLTHYDRLAGWAQQEDFQAQEAADRELQRCVSNLRTELPGHLLILHSMVIAPCCCCRQPCEALRLGWPPHPGSRPGGVAQWRDATGPPVCDPREVPQRSL